MNAISYEQARESLNVSMQAVKVAAKNDVLTRYFQQNSKRPLLIKEQVALFKGKRLSLRSLSLQEEKEWKRYKRMAETPTDIVAVEATRAADQIVASYNQMFSQIAHAIVDKIDKDGVGLASQNFG